MSGNRPRPELEFAIIQLLLEGRREVEICEMLNISRVTVYEAKKEYPLFFWKKYARKFQG